MSLTVEQLAELMAGIVRAQQAIIDAAESQEPGFKNTHLLPKLTTASNPRLPTARLIDLPSRLLLRSQGRVPMDVETIARDLHAAMGAVAPASAASRCCSRCARRSAGTCCCPGRSRAGR